MTRDILTKANALAARIDDLRRELAYWESDTPMLEWERNHGRWGTTELALVETKFIPSVLLAAVSEGEFRGCVEYKRECLRAQILDLEGDFDALRG